MLCRLRVTSVTMRYIAAELSLGVDCQSRSRKGSCPTDKAIWLLFGSRDFISAKVFFLPWLQNFHWWILLLVAKKAAFWFFPPTRRACWAFWFLMKQRASEMVTIVAVHEDDGNGDNMVDDWWQNKTTTIQNKTLGSESIDSHWRFGFVQCCCVHVVELTLNTILLWLSLIWTGLLVLLVYGVF